MKNGFTLIEILIVVTLIGALAIAMMAMVNPFEQIRKGNDTSRREASINLYSAATQYYIAKGAFPWSSPIVGLSATAGAAPGYLTSFVSVGGLNASFPQLSPSTILGKLYMTSTLDSNGNLSNLTVCYLPESQTYLSEANARYTASGTAGTTCISQSGSNQCYWCVQ